MVFSGSLVQNGEGRVLVTATGMATQIGSIVALTKATKAAETPIHKELQLFHQGDQRDRNLLLA